jgi:hypothetical protein
MIEPGNIVSWSPAKEQLHKMFHRDTAFRLYQRIPITGILKRKDGNVGLLACIAPSGKREEIPVYLSELIPAGVPHAE